MRLVLPALLAASACTVITDPGTLQSPDVAVTGARAQIVVGRDVDNGDHLDDTYTIEHAAVEVGADEVPPLAPVTRGSVAVLGRHPRVAAGAGPYAYLVWNDAQTLDTRGSFLDDSGALVGRVETVYPDSVPYALGDGFVLVSHAYRQGDAILGLTWIGADGVIDHRDELAPGELNVGAPAGGVGAGLVAAAWLSDSGLHVRRWAADGSVVGAPDVIVSTATGLGELGDAIAITSDGTVLVPFLAYPGGGDPVAQLGRVAPDGAVTVLPLEVSAGERPVRLDVADGHLQLLTDDGGEVWSKLVDADGHAMTERTSLGLGEVRGVAATETGAAAVSAPWDGDDHVELRWLVGGAPGEPIDVE